MDLTLPLGASGLTLADIGLRLYSGAVRQTLPAGVALTPLTGDAVDYVLSGLPDTGDNLIVTGEYPAGIGFELHWNERSPVPPRAIVPVRTGGLDLAGLGVSVARDGISVTAGITATELGTVEEAGDYAVAGWPTTARAAAQESWTVRARMGGTYYARTWTVPRFGYASVDDFLAKFNGANSLRLSTGYMPAPNLTDAEVRAIVQDALDAATARMNAALSNARYAVPVLVESIADPAEAIQVAAALRSICIDGAAAQLAIGLSDIPATLTAAEARFNLWARSLIGVLVFDDFGNLVRRGQTASLPGLARVA